MADALTLAGISALGFMPGTAQVLLSPSGDIGAPTPDAATISSLLLDGDQFTGDRYGNRQMTLPFLVTGTSRPSLSATVDAFFMAVSAKTWQMVWTPNGCPSTVWNCFRATPTPAWEPRAQGELFTAHVSISFQAQPFGYSSTAQTFSKSATGTRGSVFTISPVLGSARTPVTLSAKRASGSVVDMLLHSPPPTQDANATIFSPLSSGSVTIAAANMKYNGTYSIVALLSSSDTVARTITATIVQKLSGTTIATFTPSVDVVGSLTMVTVGEINLPVVKIPSDNTNCSTVITLSSTGSDAFSDVALCDTKGQTILLTGLGALSAQSVWVDPPDPTVGVGPVYSSLDGTRNNAISALKQALISGGPMLFDPSGTNKLLVASTSGAPGASGSYTPAWLHEAQA